MLPAICLFQLLFFAFDHQKSEKIGDQAKITIHFIAVLKKPNAKKNEMVQHEYHDVDP